MSDNITEFKPSKVAQRAKKGDSGLKGASGGGKPTIDILKGDIERMVDEAEAALIASRRPYYQRASKVVTCGFVRISISNDRESEAQRIFEAPEHALMEALTSVAKFRRWNERREEWAVDDCPMKVVRTLQQRGDKLKLPILAGLINAPTLRPDGSVIERPGYDKATGLLYDPRLTRFPPVPAKPTRAEAIKALSLLRSLLGSFPFVEPTDRAVALSALITACVRRSLRTAPMHAFTAPVASSGKSTLVDVACALATGREAAVMSLGKTPEETEKRLGGALLSGDPVLAIDNCEAGLGGDLLCQLLTQTTVRIRMLGQSEMTEMPTNAFLTATGNNLVLVGDMSRRAVVCRLDPGVERPELREFGMHPVTAVKEDRGLYVVAVLTILRAYQAAGRPPQAAVLGSFEEWCRTVRDALLWLGEADPVATLEEARKSDPKLDALYAVLNQWHEVIGDEEVTASKAITRAEETRDGTWSDGGYVNPQLREALLDVAGHRGKLDVDRLGKFLRSNRDRIVHGLCFCKQGVTGGSARWRVVMKGGEGP